MNTQKQSIPHNHLSMLIFRFCLPLKWCCILTLHEQKIHKARMYNMKATQYTEEKPETTKSLNLENSIFFI